MRDLANSKGATCPRHLGSELYGGNVSDGAQTCRAGVDLRAPGAGQVQELVGLMVADIGEDKPEGLANANARPSLCEAP